MVPAEPLRLILRGDDADCAVVAMALYTGASYADVMRAVVRVAPGGGKDGLTTFQMRKTLARLGMSTRFTKHVDYEGDYGILVMDNHVAVLKEGQIVEPCSTWIGIWDAENYLAASGHVVVGILLCKES